MSTLLLASLAAAQTLGGFQVRSVNTTAPFSPMSVVGDLFQSAAGSSTGPTELAIDSNQGNQSPEFDSYVAIDSGPSFGGAANVKGDGFQANPGDMSIIGNPFANPGEIGGLWFMDAQGPRPHVEAVPNSLFGNRPALFLGRFSFRTTTGATPSGTITLGPGGLGVEARNFPIIETGLDDTVIVHFTQFNVGTNNGFDPSTAAPVTFNGPGLILTTHVFQAGPLPGGNARWEVHDLYVVEVPSPATAAVVGLSVLGVARRRRR